MGCMAVRTSAMKTSLHPRKKGTLSATLRKMNVITWARKDGAISRKISSSSHSAFCAANTS
eukprot:CAMPEP_0118954886 /NCGR_PEP_ID=MMETSP1169-20130426/59086_1 /TAXON_ID=36882 /ORGANISM="Pyramimonas obovata, Strain CCMP722" /LENGTH=60 /DNA_ID=CAMNT_0006902607 /DNA_START=76 /DNA_END=258 /DNA_ORIENTATION=+